MESLAKGADSATRTDAKEITIISFTMRAHLGNSGCDQKPNRTFLLRPLHTVFSPRLFRRRTAPMKDRD